jgi:hypothetical protein
VCDATGDEICTIACNKKNKKTSLNLPGTFICLSILGLLLRILSKTFTPHHKEVCVFPLKIFTAHFKKTFHPIFKA